MDIFKGGDPRDIRRSRYRDQRGRNIYSSYLSLVSLMESPQATIRPLIIHKRNSLETFQKPPQYHVYTKASSPGTSSKTEKDRSRRFSLPIETIPEVVQLEETGPTIYGSIVSEGPPSHLSLEQNKSKPILGLLRDLDRTKFSSHS